MIAKIIKIGNSKGIRIPSAILRECNIEDQVELLVEKDSIIIKSKKCRDGWDNAFQEMSKNGDDALLHDDFIDEGMEDWEWK